MTKLLSCCHLMLIFMSAAILWDSLVLKSTKLALFYITPSVPVSIRHKTGIILHHSVCSGFHASQNWHYSTSLRLFQFPCVTKLALFYITPSVLVSMRHKTGIILHHSVCSGFHASQNWHYSTSLRLFRFTCVIPNNMVALSFR